MQWLRRLQRFWGCALRKVGNDGRTEGWKKAGQFPRRRDMGKTKAWTGLFQATGLSIGSNSERRQKTAVIQSQTIN